MKTIPEQVRLSPAVAFNIVLQGIKVRLGRSIVTILGVALGIAFLSSILAGRIIETGVAREKQLRVDVNRMMSFLTAETGDLKGHEVLLAVHENGPDVSISEIRLIAAIKDAGAQLSLVQGKSNGLPDAISSLPDAKPGTKDALAVVVIGSDQNLDALSPLANVIAYTRAPATPVNTAAASAPAEPASQPTAVVMTQPQQSIVALSRQLSEEEIKEAAEIAGRARARDLWIVIIALGVTVIGITNSMLMSVTERFREIGTMRCLGAVSGFIRRLFLIESLLVGVVGAAGGALGGAAFAILVYGFRFGFPLVLGSLNYPGLLIDFACAVAAGVILSILAALYPAGVAARMVPATALRTNV